jgi:hypothetical protein
MDERPGAVVEPPLPRAPAAAYLSCRGRSVEDGVPDPAFAPRRWPLEDRILTVGRAPEADVALPDDPMVSRVHALVECVAGRWTVVDNGLSRNGTYVNGRRVAGRRALHDRDEIRVGATVLTFCAPAEADTARTVVGEPLLTPDRLSAGQRAVLRALCRPYLDGRPYPVPATNAEIAQELFLSVDAVKAHLRGLFHRFDIDHLPQNAKRARLAEMALRYGLASGA